MNRLGMWFYLQYSFPADEGICTYRCRLNEQHGFLVDLIGGSPIHASIPKDRLFAVADIATGTG
jgi:hypothetical protein